MVNHIVELICEGPLMPFHMAAVLHLSVDGYRGISVGYLPKSSDLFVFDRIITW